MRRRVERRHDPTSMAVAARLLEINPDVVTAWNLRRETIVSLAEEAAAAEAAHSTETNISTTSTSTTDSAASPDSSPYSPPLEDELALTEKTLRKNPKSYPSWHHRRWTVRRIVEAARSSQETAADADTVLAREMRLVEKLLEMDDRNFHCWGYRRFVAALGSEVPLPAIPALADVPASEVRAHQYTGDLQVSAGVPLNQMVWLGGVVGAQYFELGYKEVLYPTPADKLAPLQTHSYLSATLGARMMFKWSELSLDIRGGGALPLMFNQSPNSEGQWSSFGVWTRTRLGYQLSSSFAVALSLGYIRYGADYTGPAQQADYTFEQPVYYTAASGSDQSAEAQISLSYQL